MTAITRRLPQRRQRAATGQAIVTPRVAAGTAQIILWVVVLTLNAIGLAMVLSASSVTSLYDGTGTWATSIRQGIWFVLGLIAMIVASRIDYRRWAAVMPFAVVAALASLIVVILPGVGTSANGSVRWIDLGPLTVQPAELVKLALILYLAQLLASRQGIVDDPRQSVHPVMIVLLAVGVLLLMQPDLGSMILIAAIALRDAVRRRCAGAFVGSLRRAGRQHRRVARHRCPVPASTAAGVPRPVGVRSTARLSEDPVAGRHRVRWRDRGRHRRGTCQVGVPARGPHRLHLFARGRGDGARRCAAGARPVRGDRGHRQSGRASCPGRLRYAPGRRDRRVARHSRPSSTSAPSSASCPSPVSRCRSCPSAGRRSWWAWRPVGVLLQIGRQGRA